MKPNQRPPTIHATDDRISHEPYTVVSIIVVPNEVLAGELGGQT